MIFDGQGEHQKVATRSGATCPANPDSEEWCNVFSEPGLRTPGSGIVRGGGLLAAAFAATLAGETVWAVKRPLPTQAEVDASGTVAGGGGGGGGDRPPLRVVALGDSTLTGPGLSDSRQIWLRKALEEIDHHRPIELVSLAVGGSRVADVARRVPEVIDLKPDLVVVAAGANDVLRFVPARLVRSDLDRLIDQLLDVVDVIAVANVGDLGNVARIPPPLTSVFRARSDSMRLVVEDVVAQHERAILLDVTGADPAFRNRDIFTADLFHPGEAGHAAWAASVRPGLRHAIERIEATRPQDTADIGRAPPAGVAGRCASMSRR